jgi:hypothetical protein
VSDIARLPEERIEGKPAFWSCTLGGCVSPSRPRGRKGHEPAARRRSVVSTVCRTIATGRQADSDVLADERLYPLGVVGIQSIATRWPESGSRLHHSFGIWPTVVDDATEILAVRPGEPLDVRPRGRLVGEAQIAAADRRRAALHPACNSARGRCAEPAPFTPAVLNAPLLASAKREAYRQLAMLTEGGGATPTDHPTSRREDTS